MEDVTAYADSLDGPVGLVGWGSALWALVAAEQPASVAAVAAYEPGANEAMDPAMGERVERVLAGVGRLAAERHRLGAAPPRPLTCTGPDGWVEGDLP